MSKDLCFTNWKGSKECAELGSEWRLPRIEEFKKYGHIKILSEV